MPALSIMPLTGQQPGRNMRAHGRFGRRQWPAVVWQPAARAAIVALAGLGPVEARAEALRVSASCTETATEEDRLVSVANRGELVLSAGGRILLSGIRLPDQIPLADQAKAWLERRQGQPIAYTQRGGTDRWGLKRVDAITGEDEPEDLALELIGNGLAYVDPGESDALCRADLLKAEASPRALRLGVWAEQPFSALDGAALAARGGRFTVAEGRVHSVRETRHRTYLNFVGPGEPGLSVTVTKRTWRIMLERGLTAESLKGRSVRVRGTVEIWRGPVLDIASPDVIELLDGERTLRR